MRHPARVDFAVPALFLVVAVGELAGTRHGPPVPFLAAYLLAVGALCWRRTLTALTPVVVALVGAGSALAGGQQSFLDAASWLLPPALACYAAGRYTPFRQLWLATLSVLFAMLIMYASLVRLVGFNADVLFGLIVYLGPWASGIAVRRAVEQSAALAVEAERERARLAAAERDAAHRERMRVSTEVHDLMAHSLTAMVVQATLAEDRLATDPDGAADALRAVQQRGRDALGETRELLLGLRENEPADVPALLARFRDLGLDVQHRVSGMPDISAVSRLPRRVQAALFRVLQESLTNALRHAPSAAAEVSLCRTEDVLDVVVINRPRLPNPHGHPAPDRAWAGTGAGIGLLGMRERVAALGGEVLISSEDPERFCVRVNMPLTVPTAE